MNASDTTIKSGNLTFLTISAEGRITLGPNITWDEAAEHFLVALEKATGRPVERASTPTPPSGQAADTPNGPADEGG